MVSTLDQRVNSLRFDGLALDLADRTMTVAGQLIGPPAKEFDLLAFLAARPGQVFTRAELLEHVWNSKPEWQSLATVTEHIHRLRAKIEPDPTRPRYLRTVRCKGYTFESADPQITPGSDASSQSATCVRGDNHGVAADVAVLAACTPADLVVCDVGVVAPISQRALRSGAEIRITGLVADRQQVTSLTLDHQISADAGEFDGALAALLDPRRRSGEPDDLIGVHSNGWLVRTQMGAPPGNSSAEASDYGTPGESLVPTAKTMATDVSSPALDVRAAAFDRLAACAAVLDGEGVIVDTNRAWRLFTQLNDGAPLSTGIGVNYLDVCDRATAAGVDVSDEVASGIRQILNGERDRFDAEYPCPSPTEDRWFMLQASALPVRDGAGAAVFHIDITARKQHNDRLVVLADHDALTGLPNRRSAARHLDEWLAHARATDTTLSVLFIDIDEFKSVNDTFGHHVGDELLVKVGLRADRALRDGDILCRFGGDEFVVICPGADRDQMLVVADRLRAVMSAPFQIGEVELFGRISVGLAESSPTSTAESMLRAADQDMYVDKSRSPVPPPRPAPLSSPAGRGPLGSRSVAAARVAQDPEVVGLSNELARAAAALRTSSDLVIFFAADGTIEWVSPACMNLFGFRPDDIVGLNAADLVHPDDQARAVAELMSIPNLGDHATTDFRVTDGLGRIRWIEETATNLLDDPSVGSVVGNLRDVTERVGLLERVELDRRRLLDAQAAARLGSFEYDLDTGDITRSDELCRILGVAIGNHANSSALDSVHPDDRPALTAMLERAATGQGRGELDYRIVRPTGEVRWVRTHGVRLPGPNANLIAGTMLDITDRHEADEALRFQATHDWLTGLPNPATLHDNLRHMLANTAPGAHVMVAVVGIDNFRQINDVNGSLTGDDALRSVAARIDAWTEPGDLVGRIRGDEFMVARSCHAVGADAVEFGRGLKDMLGESPAVGDEHASHPRLSFSVGITTTSGVDSPESIIADADAAMDDANRDGGDRVVVFDDDARARATRRRNISAALALALERDELRLEYQPIVDLADLGTVGFEALIRWTHPDLGDIAPAEFIPIAESGKLIGPIGTWVIEHAMQQLADWRRDPRVSADLWMAVNVSAQQLSQGRLADRVRESLERTGIPADLMHLEITESVLMDHVDHALTTVTELHSLGLNISIDDFGTGYSSLSYLDRLPVNRLKIDRSFVNALSATRGGTSIVRAIINLAHSLELSVVAEGVETSQQLEMLRELGCTNGQGFLWSRSLPSDDALHWITTGPTARHRSTTRRRNNVHESGPSGGRPILFAHGFGCSQEMWRHVTPDFDDYRVVVFDHVGAGRSDHSAYDRAKYDSLHGYVDDVLEIVEELDLRDVVYVGHSVSAMIGVLAATRAPSRFSDLVLVGPSPRYLNDDGYVGGFDQADIDRLLMSLDENYLGWSSVMGPVIMGNPHRPELGAELTDSFCRTDPAIARHFAAVTFLSDNRRDLPLVTTPTLVVQCSDDAIAPLCVGKYVHQQITNSELVLLDATGHCPNLSAPAELSAVLRRRLERS